MQKTKLVKYAGIVLAIAVISVILFTNFAKDSSSLVSLAKEIEDDYDGIDKLIQERVQEESQVAMSSNPYDYIKDNEHYDSLVNKGIDALPILEEKLANNEYQDGLMAYVTAIAIEDISGCDTRANQNAAWSAADEFIDYWNGFTKTVDKKVEEIINSNVSDEKKLDEMKKYGIFSVPAMQNMKDGKLEKRALEKKQKALESYGVSIKDNAKVNKIKKYMKKKAE